VSSPSALANTSQGYDSYLNFDNPVVLNLNPFFLLEDDPTPARNNQVTRAASLVISALEFVRAVRKEELPPDRIRGRPLCMFQFSRLFGTARVPTEAGCRIEQDLGSSHVVVLCRGQFYWFDVLDRNSDVLMTEKQLAVNLRTIVEDASQTPVQDAARGALGVLSTENRKTWSGLRDMLLAEPGSNNADCLGIVDSALFVLCLDDTEPADVDALSQNMLCGTSLVERGVQTGTCTNRWYDKLQIIVCHNGSAGINFEHTGVDGHTVLRFASDIYTDTILRFARSINGQAPTLWASTSPDPSRRRDLAALGDDDNSSPTPRKLEWDMTPELRIAVRFAETRLADLIGQYEFYSLDFSAYGKLLVTSMGFSPDAFVQMAFQAAYYGLYGRVECTYEPAMTKVFLHGRTEAIRTVSDESISFVQSFWGDNPVQQKVDALRAACQRHTATTRECAKAEGCDRHLYALLCVWQRHLDDDRGSSSSSSSSSRSGSSGSPPHATSSSPTDNSRGRRPNGSPAGKDPILCHVCSRSHDSHGHGPSRLPSIFADAGWDKLNTTILSTSNCGNPSLRQFGFGPTSADGFAIGYIIKDDSMSFCVSSRHRQTKRFVDTLESYLLEIRRMLRIVARNKGGGAGEAQLKLVPAPTPVPTPDSEPRSSPLTRVKSRGRLITPSDDMRSQDGAVADDNEDELGGCKCASRQVNTANH